MNNQKRKNATNCVGFEWLNKATVHGTEVGSKSQGNQLVILEFLTKSPVPCFM
jgi:hypothetical protein